MTKESKELTEELYVAKLEEFQNLERSSKEYGIVRQDLAQLAEILAAADKNDNEALDKEERRRIEEERNLMQNEIEAEKVRISWKKVAFEMAKILSPVLLSGIIFSRVHEECMEFEETGRVTSTSGRGLMNLANRFLK